MDPEFASPAFSRSFQPSGGPRPKPGTGAWGHPTARAASAKYSPSAILRLRQAPGPGRGEGQETRSWESWDSGGLEAGLCQGLSPGEQDRDQEGDGARPRTEGLPSPLGGRGRKDPMVALVPQGTDSMWRWREAVWVPCEIEGHPSPRSGAGEVLLFPRAEQLLAHWTRLPRGPAGPGKLLGVAATAARSEGARAPRAVGTGARASRTNRGNDRNSGRNWLRLQGLEGRADFLACCHSRPSRPRGTDMAPSWPELPGGSFRRPPW